MDKEKLILWQFREIGQFNKNTIVVFNDCLNRQMILKILPRENTPVLTEIMNIKHPNLMEIYDVVDNGINCSCLCEFVFGNTLEQIVLSKGEVEPQQAEKWMGQLCDGVSKLHESKIIHRDITPSNVMVDYNGNIKLIDFNISREKKNNAKRDTTVMGTAGYASPEQFGFTQTGEGADIYAMGVLLNFLLTAKMPNEKLCTGKYVNIVKKATQIRAEDRYSSVLEFKKALKSKSGEKLPLLDRILLNTPGFRSNKTSHKVIAVIFYIIYFFWFYNGITYAIHFGDYASFINGCFAFTAIPFVCFFDVGNISRFLGKGSQNSRKTVLKIIGIVLVFAIPSVILLINRII